MQPTSPFSEISTNTSIYPPRTTLYCQGEHLNGVFIIRRGAVKLTMISNNGKSVILGFAYPGNILGLSEFFSHAPSSALAETTMECLLSYVQCPNFQNFLSGHVEAAIEVARQATGSYQNACRQISLLALSGSAAERIAQFLLNEADSRPAESTNSPGLRLTHEEIAQLTGSARETVTRTLSTFKTNGWAHLEASKIIINDRKALTNLAHHFLG